MEHRVKTDIVTIPCSHCGNEIKERESRLARNRDGSICLKSFCNRACYDQHRANIRQARSKACPRCGSAFVPEIGTDKKYCSEACWKAEKKGKPHNCINCGCLFSPVKQIKRRHGIEWISVNTKDGRVTCSRDCHLEWIRKNPERKAKISKAFKGELHPNWKGGRKWLTDASYRGAEWKAISERARKRDGYKCQHCGLSQDESKAKSGRDLDVHHIVPFHNWPNAKQANKMSNLITLCASCHRIEEAKCEEVQLTLQLSETRSGQRPGSRKGAKHYSAKLNELQVSEIRRRAGRGESYAELAAAFGVGTTNICAIINRKTWKHVE